MNPNAQMMATFTITEDDVHQLHSMFSSARPRAKAFLRRWAEFGVAQTDPDSFERTSRKLDELDPPGLRHYPTTSHNIAALNAQWPRGEISRWEEGHPLGTARPYHLSHDNNDLRAWLAVGVALHPVCRLIDPHIYTRTDRLRIAADELIDIGATEIILIGSYAKDGEIGFELSARIHDAFSDAEDVKADRYQNSDDGFQFVIRPRDRPVTIRALRYKKPMFHDRFIKLSDRENRHSIGVSLGYGAEMFRREPNPKAVGCLAHRLPADLVERVSKEVQRQPRT